MNWVKEKNQYNFPVFYKINKWKTIIIKIIIIMTRDNNIRERYDNYDFSGMTLKIN